MKQFNWTFPVYGDTFHQILLPDPAVMSNSSVVALNKKTGKATSTGVAGRKKK